MNSQMIGSMCGLATAADCVLPPGVVDANLGSAALKAVNNLSDVESVATSRTNLGLTSMATIVPGAGRGGGVGVRNQCPERVCDDPAKRDDPTGPLEFFTPLNSASNGAVGLQP